MKTFISWSGDESRIIAKHLHELLKETIQVTDPWISPDISKGGIWMNELLAGLQDSHMGIVCLTPSNLDSKWIHFEAGAIAVIPARNVCTLLYDVKPEDVSPPLSLYNSTIFEKEDVKNLMQQINAQCRTRFDGKLDDKTLAGIIDKNWDRWLAEIENELSKLKTNTVVKRSDSEKIDEIVNISRSLEKVFAIENKWYDIEINGKYYRKCVDGEYKEIVKTEDGTYLMKCINDEWREVVGYEWHENHNLILQIQIKLRENGYSDVKTENVMGRVEKAALLDFQKKNGLPIGGIDYDTLKALGIK